LPKLPDVLNCENVALLLMPLLALMTVKRSEVE